MQQEGAELVRLNGVMDLGEGFALGWIQSVRGAGSVDAADRHRLALEGDDFFPAERPRRCTGAFYERLEVLQVVRARVQFEKRYQLALRLGQFRGGVEGSQFQAQAVGRRAQRV